jgi:hypothetical protein
MNINCESYKKLGICKIDSLQIENQQLRRNLEREIKLSVIEKKEKIYFFLFFP